MMFVREERRGARFARVAGLNLASRLREIGEERGKTREEEHTVGWTGDVEGLVGDAEDAEVDWWCHFWLVRRRVFFSRGKVRFRRFCFSVIEVGRRNISMIRTGFVVLFGWLGWGI
jgi:hypothetical protein